MKKRIWTFALCIVMALAFLPNGVAAEELIEPVALEEMPIAESEEELEDTCVELSESKTKDGFTYEIDNKGNADIIGYSGLLTDVVVPAEINGYPVTSISGAFTDNTVITSVELPDGITEIGFEAFEGCINLKSINIPNGVKMISEEAFYNCSSLTNVTIPSSVQIIELGAFERSGLETVVIGAQYIESYAFSKCNNLSSLVLSPGVKNVDDNAFCYCEKLKTVRIPATIQSMSGFAFVFSDNVTEVTYDGTPEQWKEIKETYNVEEYWYEDVDHIEWMKFGLPATAFVYYKTVQIAATLNMKASTTYALHPVFTPSDTADKELIWKSSDTAVASVSQDGVVKGVGRGTATITATSKSNSSIKASCKVTVLFKDVTLETVSSGMYKAIYWVADKKITGEKVTFGTFNSMTRGQFVRFLYRYAGNPKVASTMIKKYGSKFPDVDKNYTHFNAIVWAVSKGLIGGYDDGTFRPNDPLTRGNVATILWKFAGKPSVKNNKNPFVDVPKSTCITWGKQKKIFGGYSDGTFKPDDNCLRGDFALFLYRYNNKVGKK